MSRAMITFVDDGEGGMSVQLGFDRPIEQTREGMESMTPVERFAVATYTAVVARLEETSGNSAVNVTEH